VKENVVGNSTDNPTTTEGGQNKPAAPGEGPKAPDPSFSKQTPSGPGERKPESTGDLNKKR